MNVQSSLAFAPISEARMRADLAAGFPGLWLRPIREFGVAYVDQEGFWTGTGAFMPTIGGGMPIIDSNPSSDDYDGWVHHGFVEWLARRGWCWHAYDAGTFFLEPNYWRYGYAVGRQADPADVPDDGMPREYVKAWRLAIAERGLGYPELLPAPRPPFDPNEVPF